MYNFFERIPVTTFYNVGFELFEFRVLSTTLNIVFLGA